MNSEEIKQLESIQRKFARYVSVGLQAQLDFPAQMEYLSSSESNWEDISENQKDPFHFIEFSTDPIPGFSYFLIQNSWANSMIESLFGVEKLTEPLLRELSDIDISILEGIFVRILGNIRASWYDTIKLYPRLNNIETEFRILKENPKFNQFIRTVFQVSIQGRTSPYEIWIPKNTIEQMLQWKEDPGSSDTPAIESDTESKKEKETNLIPNKKYKKLKKKILSKTKFYAKEFLNFVKKHPKKSAHIFELADTLNHYYSLPPFLSGIWVDEALGLLVSLARRKTEFKFLNHLEKDRVNTLLYHVNRLEYIDEQKIGNALYLFNILRSKSFRIGGTKTIQKILSKIEPKYNLPNRLESILQMNNSKPFSELQETDIPILTRIMKSEHPQTIAGFLEATNLPWEKQLLQFLPRDLADTVLRRKNWIRPISPDVLREMDRVLLRKVSYFRNTNGN